MSETVRAVNAAIADSVAALADDFRPEPPPPGAAPTTSVRAEGATTQTTLSNVTFSALVEILVDAGGSEAVHYVLPLTFDLRTGRAMAPADLFVAGTPWADTLAAHVERGVLRQLADDEGYRSPEAAREALFADGLAPIREGRVDLTLEYAGVTVHVPPYQLSDVPTAFRVTVPYRALRPFAPDDGLIALAPQQ